MSFRKAENLKTPIDPLVANAVTRGGHTDLNEHRGVKLKRDKVGGAKKAKGGANEAANNKRGSPRDGLNYNASTNQQEGVGNIERRLRGPHYKKLVCKLARLKRGWRCEGKHGCACLESLFFMYSSSSLFQRHVQITASLPSLVCHHLSCFSTAVPGDCPHFAAMAGPR